PAADVTKLMSDDCFQLRRRQTIEDAFWQQQDRPKNTENARLQNGRTGHCPDWYVKLQKRSRTNGGPDAPPMNQPPTGDNDESAYPYTKQNCRKRDGGRRWRCRQRR